MSKTACKCLHDFALDAVALEDITISRWSPISIMRARIDALVTAGRCRVGNTRRLFHLRLMSIFI